MALLPYVLDVRMNVVAAAAATAATQAPIETPVIDEASIAL
jgi:hypothetical protein